MHTLEDLKNEKCCVTNDGTLEELKLVLSKVVPNDKSKIYGTSSFYHVNGKLWFGTLSPRSLPVQSVKDFVKQIKQDKYMRKIKIEQAQAIIDIACQTWKTKLAKLWGESMVLNKYVEISEEFYQEMRKACTQEQHKLFDEIFGPQYNYKVGDWVVYLKESGENYIDHGRKTNRAYSVCEISDGGVRTFTEDNKTKNADGWSYFEDVRPATEEEILQAKCPYYDGQPCLVFGSAGWIVRYATGRISPSGKVYFYINGEKKGNDDVWEKHIPLPEGFVIPN